MKRILHIIPYYNLYPPMNGGHLRCFHLMDQMALHHKVDVICYQKEEDILAHGYKNENVRFFHPGSFKRQDFWRLLPPKIEKALRYRYLRRNIYGPAGATVLDFAHVSRKLSEEREYDYVVSEHRSTMLLSPIVRRFQKKAKLIYDAHNIDYKLIRDSKVRSATKKTESKLYQEVDCFWACSQKDVDELEEMNHHKIQGVVVPNGVDVDMKPFVKNKEGLENKLLFCGSLDYYPNAEGLHWFFEKVWPSLKKSTSNIEITIIGRGNAAPFDYLMNDGQVNFIGEVEDVAPYYRETCISIVPLLSGSGTRLKVLEAMSFGNPVVTTSIGIEGIDARENIHALITDNPKDFSSAIIKLIGDVKEGDRLRKNALRLIKQNYDWCVIGDKINKFISSYLSEN